METETTHISETILVSTEFDKAAGIHTLRYLLNPYQTVSFVARCRGRKWRGPSSAPLRMHDLGILIALGIFCLRRYH